MSEELDLLVLAAFEPELSGVSTRARAAVGVGLSAAGGGTARALLEHRPKRALLVGTCGAYPGAGLALLDVVVAQRVHLVEPAVVEGRAAFAPSSALAIEVASLDVGARRVDVATTLAVTTDDALARALRDASGCDVEHLEAHAVAVACAAAGVELAIVLGVANIVGAGARDEWRAHHAAASEAVARVVNRLGARAGSG